MGKTILGPLTPVSTSPEYDEWQARHSKAKGKRESKADLEPELVAHVRAVLVEAGHALSILEIAKRVAARMGAELPAPALLFPTHPSRMTICAVIANWSIADLDAIFAEHWRGRVVAADPPPGQLSAPTMTYLASDL